MSFMLPFRMIVATHSRRSLRSENVQTNFTPNSFPLNPFADPHPLTPVASIFYKNIGGGGTVSPFQLLTSKSQTSFICHTSEKSARKCNHFHTSRNNLSQVLCLPHL